MRDLRPGWSGLPHLLPNPLTRDAGLVKTTTVRIPVQRSIVTMSHAHVRPPVAPVVRQSTAAEWCYLIAKIAWLGLVVALLAAVWTTIKFG